MLKLKLNHIIKQIFADKYINNIKMKKKNKRIHPKYTTTKINEFPHF